MYQCFANNYDDIIGHNWQLYTSMKTVIGNRQKPRKEMSAMMLSTPSLKRAATLSKRLLLNKHMVSNLLLFKQILLTLVIIVIDYVEELLKATLDQCAIGSGRTDSKAVPLPLCSDYERPVKSEAVKSHKSRFSLPK